jgi:hypothetical protein
MSVSLLCGPMNISALKLMSDFVDSHDHWRDSIYKSHPTRPLLLLPLDTPLHPSLHTIYSLSISHNLSLYYLLFPQLSINNERGIAYSKRSIIHRYIFMLTSLYIIHFMHNTYRYFSL